MFSNPFQRRRRKGQSMVEFAVVTPVLMLVILLSSYLMVALFNNWSASRGLEILGRQLVTVGVFDGAVQTKWLDDAKQVGSTIDPARGDSLTITIISPDGTTGTYSWNSEFAVGYGDHVELDLSMPMILPVASDLVSSVVPFPATSAHWSGISQRNADPNAVVGAPVQAGSIAGTVFVRRLVEGVPTLVPLSGATVVVDSGSPVTSASDGSYSLRNVAPGTRSVSVYKSGFARTTVAVTVVSGQSASQDLVTTDAVGVIVAAATQNTVTMLSNGSFETGTSSWSTGATFFTSPALSLTSDALARADGNKGGRIATSASSVNQGIAQTLPGTFIAGRPYVAVAWIRAAEGAEVAAAFGTGTDGDFVSVGLTGTGTWQTVVLPWTPALARTGVIFAIRASGSVPAAVTVDLDEAMVLDTAGLLLNASATTDDGMVGASIGNGLFLFGLDPTAVPRITIRQGLLVGSVGPLTLAAGHAYSRVVNEGNMPSTPTASFTAPKTAAVNEYVTFTDTSNAVTAWSWTFGDGTVSNSRNPVKRYAAVGKYTVTLTGSSAYGTSTATRTIIVSSYADLVASTAGVVGYWRLGESSGSTAFDLGPNDLNGTYVNGVVLGRTGSLTNDPDTAVTFNGGAGQMVTVPDLPNGGAMFEGRNPWTVEAWVSASPDGTFRSIFDRTQDNANGEQGLMIWSLNSTLMVERRYNGSGGGGATGAAPLTPGWHQVVATYDGSNLSLYVDGALASTINSAQTAIAAPDLTAPNVGWGNHNTYNAGNTWNGGLDEGAVYERALTPAEIASHFAAGGPRAAFTASPLTGEVPLTVTFTDTSIGATTFAWDFGDGATSTTRSPSHTFNRTGTYTVTLTASSVEGSSTATRSIVVTGYRERTLGLSGLTGYWRLGETSGTVATDASGVGNHGTYVGSPTLGVPGALTNDPNKAVTFNGAQRVSQGATSTSVGSYAVWFKRSRINATEEIVASPSGCGAPLLWFHSSTNQVRLSKNCVTEVVQSTTQITDTDWHFVVVTWNGATSGGSKMYVDGVDRTTGDNSVAFSAGVGLNIGPTWVGGLDEVAFFNRVLTPAEIAAAYTVGGPRSAFSAAPTSGRAPLVVTFTDRSVSPTSWAWDFGDGTTSTVQNPSHTYAPGSYVASLTTTSYVGPSTTSKPITAGYGGVVRSTSDLVGYWRLGETAGLTAMDESGYGNHGTYTNGPALGVAGALTNEANKSITLNGSSQFVDAGNGTVGPAGAITASGWFKTSATATQIIAARGTTGSWSWSLHTNGGRLFFNPYKADGGDHALVSSPATVNDGRWHFAAGTFDGTTARVYLDGVEVGSSTVRNGTWYQGTVGPLNIGRQSVGGNYFNGSLDEIAVFNRVLPASEISDLFAAGGPRAAFTAAAPTGVGALTVAFTDRSVSPVSWSWDFGNGQTSTVQNPSHTYAAPGTYTVTLTIIGDAGSSTAAKTITTGYAGAVITTPGLVGYWRLGETSGTVATDSSLSANHGTYVGSPTRGVPGLLTNDPDKAIQLDGTARYVSIPNAIALQLTTGTISAWIKTSNAGVADRAIVVKQSAFGLYLINNVLTAYDYTAGAYRSTGINLADGNAHHVAMSFQSGVVNGTIIYIDGLPVLTTTYTIANQTLAPTIGDGGAGGGGAGQNPSGVVDDAAVFNRVLSPAEITAQYQAGGERANFSASPTSGPAPLAVAFTDLSVGATSWAWNFGNGQTSAARNPAHTFTTVGTWTVTLTATSSSGSTTYTKTIRSLNFRDSVIATAGLVGYWRLNETSGSVASDSSGLGNHGSYVGGPRLGSPSMLTSDADKAVTLDGSSQYVSVPNSASLNFGAGSFTVMQWVNFLPGTSQLRWSIGKGRPYTNAGPGWAVDNYTSGDPVGMNMWLSGGGTGGTGPTMAAGPIARGTPAMLVWVIDRATGLGRSYRDGVLQQSNALPAGLGSTDNSSESLFIGSGMNWFDLSAGDYDDTALFNRALTSTEIAALYAAAGPRASFTASPTVGAAPLPVTFTDTSVGASAWAWNFGNGQTSTAQNPVHTFTTAGTFTVTLTASSGLGTATATKKIGVGYTGMVGVTPGLVGYWRLGEAVGPTAVDSAPVPAWTPIMAGGVTQSGTTYTKTSGAAGWGTSQVYSSIGFSGSASVSGRTATVPGNTMLALNSDPTTDANYTSLDYAWHTSGNGSLYIYENGAQIGIYGTFTTSTEMSITYDGITIRYLKDGVVQRSVARPIGATLYLDTSLYQISDGLTNVSFSGTNDGMYVNGPTLGVTGGLTNDPNTAATLNGSTQFVDAGNGTPAPAGAITVSAWFKTTSSGFQRLAMRGNSGTWSWALDATAGKIGFAPHQDYGATHVSAQSTVSANDGQWHFAVGTFDGTTARVYLDGVQVGSSTALTGTWYQGAGPLNLGRQASGSNYFDGTLDEVAIFNRVLPTSEITALYAASGPRASFTTSAPTGPAALTANFINTSTNATTWAWDFGNGQTSTVQNPSHTYAAPGTYTVTLVASSGAVSSTISKPVTVGYAGLTVATPGLVGYWRLGEASGTVATDASGLANHGTYVNGPTLGVTGLLTSDPNKAVTMNGVNQYVTVPSSASLNFGAGSFTIIQWVRWPVGTSQLRWSIGKGSPYLNAEQAWAVANYTASSPVQADLWVSGGGAGGSGPAVIGAPVPRGETAMLVWVVDRATGQARAYTNSALTTTTALPVGFGNVDNAQPLLIGAGAALGNYSAGDYDDTSLFNRALSASEITALYNAAGPRTSFTASATSGPAPLTVTFTDYSPGATSWAWNFGNGQTSTAQNPPAQTYPIPGSYVVTLTTPNALGSSSMTRTIRALNYRDTIIESPSLAGYWRLGEPAPAAVSANLVRFPAGGTATYSASTSYVNGNYNPDKAADGNTSDGWASNGYAAGQWWQVSFSTPQTLNQIIAITRSYDNFGNGHIDFSDGSRVSNIKFPEWNARTVNFATKTGITWFRIVSDSGGVSNPGFTEVEATNTPYANLVRNPVGGTATYSASQAYSNGLYNADKAADGNFDDGWAANAYAVGMWWRVDFTTGQTISEIRTTGRWPGATDSMGAGRIEFSDGSQVSGVDFVNSVGQAITRIRFAPKAGITWFRIVSDSGGTGNAGFSEVEAMASNVAADSIGTSPAAYSDAAPVTFNGTSETVNIPGVDLTSGDWTMQAWVKPTGLIDTGWHHIFGSRYGGYALGLVPVSGTWRAQATITGAYDPGYSAAAVPMDTWTHVAASYSVASRVVTYYINGVASGSFSFAAANPTAGVQTLWIGGNGQYGMYFDGSIKSARVERWAMSGAQVAAEMIAMDPARGRVGAIAGDANTAVSFAGGGRAPISKVPTAATDNFSVEAWFKYVGTYASGATPDAAMIVKIGSNAAGAGCDGYGLSIEPASGMLRGLYECVVWMNTDVVPTRNVWHHTALVRTSGVTRIYLDGVQVGGTWANAPLAPTGGGSIGSGTDGSRRFSGSIDEVAVYGRALASTEPGTRYTASGPRASFNATPINGAAPLPVTFTDTSVGATSWSWNFGNGQTSTAQSPSHTFATAGIFTVALTVTNPLGSSTETKTINVGYAGVLMATPGIVGYWRLGETSGTVAADASGQGNDGTYTNSPTLGVPGLLTSDTDKAIQLDGTTRYVALPNAAALQLTTGTIAAWIKTTNAGAGYRGVLVKQSAFGLYLADNVLTAYDYTAGVGRSTGINLADGNTHHVAMSFQSGVVNGTIIYIDGLPVLTTTYTISNQAGAPTIGSGGGSIQTPSGVVDEAAIFNRVLTPAEISAQFAAGGPRAAINVSAASGVAPFSPTFTDRSVGGATSWAWNFGNGQTSTAQNPPTQTYPLPGVFTVTLTVTSAAGSSSASTTVQAFDYAGGIAAAPNLVGYWRLGETSGTVAVDSAPAAAWTPIITGGVTQSGTNFTQTGSAPGWGSQAYASIGFSGSASVSGRAVRATGNVMFGLNSDPATDASYTSLDYAWYPNNDGTLHIYESGGYVGMYGTYTTSTDMSVTYDGATIRYVKDGIVQRSVARPIGAALYFDSSMANIGDGLTNIAFSGTNNGVYTNGPTLGVAGALSNDPNKAVTFNGSTQFVDAGNGMVGPAGAITASGWFKTSATATQIIAARGGTGSWSWSLHTNGGRLFFNPYKADGGGHALVSSPATVNDGLWHFAAGTFDGTTARLYLDGVQVGSSTALTGTWYQGTVGPLNIGRQSVGGSYFNGSLDEIAVFNRVLPASEIAAFFTAGGPRSSFTAAAPTGVGALTVAFTNTSTSSTTWAWDFGNGQTSTAQNPPAHAYATPGTYTVTLVASSIYGSSTATKTVTTGYAGVTLTTPGLVLYWRLGEASGTVATDASGNGRTGTYSNNPGLGQPALISGTDTSIRTYGGASGAGQVVEAPTNLALGTHTAAVWFRRVGPSGGTYPEWQHMFRNLMGTQGNLYVLSDGSSVLYQANLVGGGVQNYFGAGSGTAPFADDMPHFLVSTYNGTTMRIYIDGVEFGTGVTANLLTDTTADRTSLGRADNYTPNGFFDEATIWNRALTPAEITNLFAAAGPRPAFTASAPAGVGGLTVSFTNTSIGSTSWAWNFGNGQTSTAQNPPAHAYATPGTYTVTLVASAGGLTSTVTKPVIVGYAGAVTSTPGLIGYWRLGETAGTTAVDSSGYGRSGTYFGGPTLGVAGLLTNDPNKAVLMDGVDDRVSTNANLPTATRRTWSAWITPTQVTKDQMFMANETTSANYFRIVNSKLFGSMNLDGSQLTIAGATTLVNGQTYFVALTYDGTALRLYLNGVQDGILVVAGNLGFSADVLNLGRWTSANPWSFVGTLDDAAVFDRALTPAQIQNHYVAGGARAFFTATPSGPDALTIGFTDQSIGATGWTWAFGDATTSTAQNPSRTYATPGSYAVTLTTTSAAGSATVTRLITAGYGGLIMATPNLIGYWRFAETSGTTATDSSGNASHGTFDGSPTLGVTGALTNDTDKATAFNGTTQGMTRSINVPQTAISYSFWTKTTTNGYERIMGIGTYSSFWVIDAGIPRFAPLTSAGGEFTSASSSVAVNDGKWHHLVGTFDGTTAKIYVDGVQTGSNSTPGAWYRPVTANFNVANYLSYFGGSIDEVALFDRALTPAEVAAEFLAGGPRAAFTASSPTGPNALTIGFTDISAGATSWAWNFGDATTSIAQNPSRTYAAAGTYTVTLVATRSSGSSTATKTITVGYAGAILATPNLVGYWRLGETSGTVAVDSAPAAAWTPIITGGVTQSGTNFTKTSGASAWDAQAYASIGFSGSASVSGRSVRTTASVMLALNSDPATDGSYTSLDYAWYPASDGNLHVYENGGYIAAYGGYTTSTNFSITYDGATIRYLKDGVVQRSVARAIGAALYFDSSMYGVGDGLTNVAFTGTNNGVYTNGPTLGVDGGLTNDPNKAATFNGSTQFVDAGNGPAGPAGTITVSGWFKTSTAATQVIVARGAPGSWSWSLQTVADGRLTFIAYQASGAGHAQAISTAAVNDGQWHFGVGTFDGTTARIYLDGVQVGSSTALTGTWYQGTVGPLNIGRQSVGGSYFNGSLDEIAVFNRVLSGAEVSTQSEAAGPRASFTTGVPAGTGGLTVAFTNTSTNATTWAWNFGNGQTSTAQNPSHTYATLGTYTVTLTASSSAGSSTISKPVTVGYAGAIMATPNLVGYWRLGETPPVASSANLVRTPVGGTASYSASQSYSNGLYNADKAADGNTNDGWASNLYEPGMWWRVDFTTGQTLNQIRATVRSSAGEPFGATHVEFSDGSSSNNLNLPGGSAKIIDFATKTGITWFKIVSDSGGAGNAGFSEVEATHAPSVNLVRNPVGGTATYSASSTYPSGTTNADKAADGNFDDGWASNGYTAGMWWRVDFTSGQTISEIRTTARSNATESLGAGRIEFSDGSQVSGVDFLNYGGHSINTIRFAPKAGITWFRIVSDSGGAGNGGFAEVMATGRNVATDAIGTSAAAYTDAATIGLNGTSETVVIPGVDLTSGDWTMQAWVKPNGQMDNNWHQVFSARQGGYAFGLGQGSTGSFRVFTTLTSVQDANAWSNGSVPRDVWTHIAATYSATTRVVNYYINGAPSGTASFSAAPWAGALTDRVGGNQKDGYVAFFKGGISRPSISRFVMTPTQIATGYYATDPTRGVAGALTADPNTATSFDAGYATISKPTVTATDNFTVETWFKYTGAYAPGQTPSRAMIALFGGIRPACGGYGIGLDTATGRLMGLYECVAWLDTAVVPSANAWHHVALVRASGTTTIYLDGVQAGGTWANTPLAPTGGGTIGAAPAAEEARGFAGVVDETAIYNRALSLAEIQAHYAAR